MASTAENTNTKTDTTKEDSSKILADGLLQLLQPVVIECDTRMNQVFKSQHLLADQIDELAKGKRNQFPSKPLELEHFMVVAQKNPPPNLLPAIQTLVKARTRVNTLNNTLNTIKERLDRMEKIANSDASTALPLPDMFSSLLGRIMSTSNTQLQNPQNPQNVQSATTEKQPETTTPTVAPVEEPPITVVQE